jgi:hypothetical protein
VVDKFKLAIKQYFKLMPDSCDKSKKTMGIDSPFSENYEELVEMLDTEQKNDVQQLILRDRCVPVSALTLVLSTSNQGRIKV